MSLPPEHISIKRRRQEEPLELLYLENDGHHTKRRFTDYCFQRVKGNPEDFPPASQPSPKVAHESQQAVNSHGRFGVPVVRVTSPGAEIREEADRRAAQKALQLRYSAKDVYEPTAPESNNSQEALRRHVSTQPTRLIAPLRRFHLHHGPRTNNPNYPSGVRKRKTERRNHLATFVEISRSSRQGTDTLEQVASRKPDSVSLDNRPESSESGESQEESLNPSPTRELEAGQSMCDHPSTWDHGSDQLAEELAAFALEISGNERQNGQRDTTPAHLQLDMKGFDRNVDMNIDQDFIYDTYVRVPLDTGKTLGGATNDDVGLLVISHEDQELWQTFVESDDDGEWDEEDPDSNAEDNPANDYPDEDADSEEEFGDEAYNHRRFESDDEEYDLNDRWSDNE